jgi:effector-binding domain-containing protein
LVDDVPSGNEEESGPGGHAQESHVPVSRIPPFIQEAFGQLYGIVAARGIRPAGPPSAIFDQRPDLVDEADVEVWVPVEPTVVPDDVEVSRVPEVPVASTVHRGPYEEMGEAYAAIDTWIAEHHREAVGPIRETYLNGPAEVDEPSEYLTEVEVPLQAG